MLGEQSDRPKRGIGRFLMVDLLAPARSSGTFVTYTTRCPNQEAIPARMALDEEEEMACKSTPSVARRRKLCWQTP